MNDRWIAGGPVAQMIYDEGAAAVRDALAQRSCRDQMADWEIASLVGGCLKLALHFVKWDAPYDAFVDHWCSTFGEEIRPHLLAIYCAAACSPAIEQPDGERRAIAAIASARAR